jgi:hypothetical protein
LNLHDEFALAGCRTEFSHTRGLFVAVDHVSFRIVRAAVARGELAAMPGLIRIAVDDLDDDTPWFWFELGKCP